MNGGGACSVQATLAWHSPDKLPCSGLKGEAVIPHRAYAGPIREPEGITGLGESPRGVFSQDAYRLLEYKDGIPPPSNCR
jgi:hypothetical protein